MGQATTCLTVPELVAGGVSLKTAVQAGLEAQGLTMAQWSRLHKKNRTSVSKLLNRIAGSPYHDIRDRLCETLELDREWLDAQIDGQSIG